MNGSGKSSSRIRCGPSAPSRSIGSPCPGRPGQPVADAAEAACHPLDPTRAAATSAEPNARAAATKRLLPIGMNIAASLTIRS
jgi:hypothetical protein